MLLKHTNKTELSYQLTLNFVSKVWKNPGLKFWVRKRPGYFPEIHYVNNLQDSIFSKLSVLIIDSYLLSLNDERNLGIKSEIILMYRLNDD